MRHHIFLFYLALMNYNLISPICLNEQVRHFALEPKKLLNLYTQTKLSVLNKTLQGKDVLREGQQSNYMAIILVLEVINDCGTNWHLKNCKILSVEHWTTTKVSIRNASVNVVTPKVFTMGLVYVPFLGGKVAFRFSCVVLLNIMTCFVLEDVNYYFNCGKPMEHNIWCTERD